MSLSAETTEDKNPTLTWEAVLAQEKLKPYFKNILATIESERALGKTIYPANSDIFNAFKLTPLEQVKVVILGQDPYHGDRQAHGLCFSVNRGIQLPPSLQNIFKEIYSDLGHPKPQHGCLESWAQQGVLLLNSVLSVEADLPGSHAKLGWQQFTDFVITALSKHCSNLVFLLWGAYAQKKLELIDQSRHHILTAAHPSPLSASRGFLGCKHFSRCNQLLETSQKTAINWQITN
jgi:uracil-DNA glycosylase